MTKNERKPNLYKEPFIQINIGEKNEGCGWIITYKKIALNALITMKEEEASETQRKSRGRALVLHSNPLQVQLFLSVLISYNPPNKKKTKDYANLYSKCTPLEKK